MELKILRGKRILQALLEKSSYDELYGNIETNFPNTEKRQHATNEVSITNIKYVPVRTTNVGGAFRVHSTSSSSVGGQYKQQVLLSGVKFTPDGNTTFTSSDNQTHTIEPVDLSVSNVRVNCNCLDFYHRFANWNFDDQSLLGKKPPPYQRKTNDRPPVNPNHVPGLCKHLIKLFDIMRQQGLVR